VLIPLAAFAEFNKKLIEAGDEPFANARNAAAGTVRQLDVSITASRRLDFFAYEIMAYDAPARGAHPFPTQQGMLDALRAWGFHIERDVKLCRGLEQVFAFHNALLERRDRLTYEVDGIVVKVNDRAAQAGSACARVRHAGPWRTSSRRAKRSPRSSTSSCKWDARGSSRLSPSSSRWTSRASP
jgi:NAD-dependent DNA ligase